jgi:hypothetical protein
LERLRGTGAQYAVSSLRAICRQKFTPQSCSPAAAGLKRSCESGILSSAVHPSESIRTATSHTASQLRSSSVSSEIIRSRFTPRAFTPNAKAERRS